jgi:hypothetical protein
MVYRPASLRWLFFGLLAFCLLAGMASGSARGATPDLAGETTISGPSGWTVVRLDQEVHPFPSDGGPLRFDVKFDSGGSFHAIALRAVDARADGQRDEMNIVRGDDGGWGFGASGTLHPGLYRLHLVADDSEGRATLKLADLAGTLAVTPTAMHAVQRVVGRVRPSALAPSTELVSASVNFGGRGIAKFDLRADYGGQSAGRSEGCEYWGPDPASAYEPSCPGGGTYDLLPIGEVNASGTRFTAGITVVGGSGRFGLGANFETFGAPPSISETAFVYTFDDSPLPVDVGSDAGPAPWVELVAHRAEVRARVARIRVACRQAKPCRVSVRLGASRAQRMTLRAGKTTVSVRVGRTTLARLRAHSTVSTALTVSGRDANGTVRAFRSRVVLWRASQHRRAR